MKKLTIRALLLAAAAVAMVAPAARAQVDVDVNVSIGGFYDELAPYGQWVDCSYGQCWVPARVASDWQPYSNGQWIYTQYGWTWVSSDPWGGNPYHYGTWASIPGYGWSWVPGTVWAPAWVTWSYSNNYVGWAPLPPTVVFGASGYSGRAVVVRETQYVFVPTNRFVGGNVTAVRVPAQQSAAIFRQTRPVTGFAVSGGIVRNTALPMATIEHASGRTIETKSIQSARTAPHAVAAGPAQWSVVAPPREVKAAVAARPQAAIARNAPADHATGNANAPKAQKAPDASPIEAHRPPAEAPAAHRPEHQAEPARPAESSDQADEEAEASAGRRKAGQPGAPCSCRAAGRAPCGIRRSRPSRTGPRRTRSRSRTPTSRSRPGSRTARLAKRPRRIVRRPVRPNRARRPSRIPQRKSRPKRTRSPTARSPDRCWRCIIAGLGLIARVGFRVSARLDSARRVFIPLVCRYARARNATSKSFVPEQGVHPHCRTRGWEIGSRAGRRSIARGSQLERNKRLDPARWRTG